MPKRATSADVAAAAGVSRATVSFVLNATPGQTISPAVRDRVRAEAVRLGYRPHPHARALVSGSSRIVLACLPHWPVEYALRQILEEGSAVLDAAGYTLVTLDPRHAGNGRPLWESLRPDVVLPLEQLPLETMDAIRALGIAIVDIDPDRVDLRGAVGLQMAHLVERGHRSIAFASTFVAGFDEMNSVRRAAYRDICASEGLPTTDSPLSEVDAPAVISRWHDAGVTAVIGFNDDVAALAVRGALRSGLRVPEDLAVIGHDDTPIARLLTPTLTTIRFDLTGLGRYLATSALSVAAGQSSRSGAPELRAEVVVREST